MSVHIIEYNGMQYSTEQFSSLFLILGLFVSKLLVVCENGQTDSAIETWFGELNVSNIRIIRMIKCII